MIFSLIYKVLVWNSENLEVMFLIMLSMKIWFIVWHFRSIEKNQANQASEMELEVCSTTLHF